MSLHTGWVHVHSIIEEPLGLIANRTFDPSPVTTVVADWETCNEALVEPFTKVIISRTK